MKSQTGKVRSFLEALELETQHQNRLISHLLALKFNYGDVGGYLASDWYFYLIKATLIERYSGVYGQAEALVDANRRGANYCQSVPITYSLTINFLFIT